MKKAIIIGVLTVAALGSAVAVRGAGPKSGTTTGTQTVTTIVGTTPPNVDTVLQQAIAAGEPSGKALKVETIKVSPSDVLLFNTPVVPESVDVAIQFLANSTADKIYLVLDSPGGSVVDGARLIEYIRYSGKNIYTVCNNFCASMAFQIFQYGKERLLVDKAILMAHPASGGAQGIIENMIEMEKMFKLYVDRMDADTARRSGIDYGKFKFMVLNNIWVETPEAMALHLADKVVHLDVDIRNSLGQLNDSPANLKKILIDRKIWNEKMNDVKGYRIILK